MNPEYYKQPFPEIFQFPYNYRKLILKLGFGNVQQINHVLNFYLYYPIKIYDTLNPTNKSIICLQC